MAASNKAAGRWILKAKGERSPKHSIFTWQAVSRTEYRCPLEFS